MALVFSPIRIESRQILYRMLHEKRNVIEGRSLLEKLWLPPPLDAHVPTFMFENAQANQHANSKGNQINSRYPLTSC
ncbi:MAG: hypothetical protein F4Z09_06520 [Rhodobacteraceae bacterium]|nr:hypothetical protein [Paracoccaceae bacterium]